MELTKTELQIADRYLSKREKQVAQWPQRRWVMLTIFSVLMFVGFRLERDGMNGLSDDRAMDFAVNRALGEEPPPGEEHRWLVGSMLKISKILEARHQIVTSSLMEAAIGYVQLISCGIMVCLIILRWNTAERDALICKLLRAKLTEFEQASAPSTRPPARPPALPEIPSPTSPGGDVQVPR